MHKNWKHAAAVVWLVAVVTLILAAGVGASANSRLSWLTVAAAMVFVVGLAVLDVRKWLASLKPAKSDG